MIDYQKQLEVFNLTCSAFNQEISSRLKELKPEFNKIKNPNHSIVFELKYTGSDSFFRPLFCNFLISCGLIVTTPKKGKTDILVIECSDIIYTQIVEYAYQFYKTHIFALQSIILKDLFKEINVSFGNHGKRLP